ncbi:MAG TPA: glutaredoxin family protein [Ramlibacter sp.]|nr:glutaredoxin family protein [Ramlibacter sp.]
MSFVRLAAAAALASLALAGTAGAQQVFRIVGPDGKVTFTDRPPQDARATPAPTVTLPGTGGGGNVQLPAELRNVSSRFPVTLYTGSDCTPCNQARNLLASRGVPFTERTVTSNEDIQALERLMGDSPRVPFATIGGQHVKGFSDVEWSQYLDAAGYPKTSQLPPGYRNPPATPLVAVQPTPIPAAAGGNQQQQAAQPQQPSPPASPSAPSRTNPAGIQF